MNLKTIFLLFAASPLITACTVVPKATTTDQDGIFLAAVEAAAVPDANATTDLWPIETDEALVVAWSNPSYYKPGTNTLTYPAWVTPVPQVQQICSSQPAGGSVAALEELLGLRPGDGPGRAFITMRVKSRDLFRPCPDTSIDTKSCPMELASAPPPGVSVQQWQQDLIFVLEQMLKSYKKADGYPFTRLGYTYNWNPTAPSPVGASEYVLRKGAKVVVESTIENTVYCAPPSG